MGFLGALGGLELQPWIARVVNLRNRLMVSCGVKKTGNGSEEGYVIGRIVKGFWWKFLGICGLYIVGFWGW